MSPTGSGLSRRDFVKAAVAIGGASALTACVGREGPPEVPPGPDDLSTIPERQHAWNDVLETDDAGNHLNARHHVILLLDYAAGGVPTDADRETFETALRGLEHAYRRGADGLLVQVGYTPTYFERFDAPLPASVDLPEPKALSALEDPEFDTPDVLVHLASNYGSVVLAAEEALFGERDTLNGTELSVTLSETFERVDRRTGFVGAGLPAAHQDVAGLPDGEPVDEDAPLYMGFKSGFERNQASEDRVTLPDGPFAGGTTAHLSKIRLNLEQWYDQDSRDQRVAKMFCPAHADQGLVDGPGDNLGTSSRIEETGCAEAVEAHARTRGTVGHSQKMARIREDGSPVILRRDFDSTDDGHTGLHFLALQRTIADFEDTREAMNGEDLVGSSAVGRRNNNGILQYMTVKRRGNYLLPPRAHRSLPRPDPQ